MRIDGSSKQLLATMALLAAVVFVLAWAGIALTRGNDRIAAVWLSNGVALAVLLRSPKARWPALIAVAWLANVGANLLSGDRWWFAASLSFANAVEILIAATLIGRIFQPQDRFDSRHVLTRFVVAAMLAPLVSSAIASGFLLAVVGSPFAPTFFNWYASDALGLLTFAPLLLAVRVEQAMPRLRERIEPLLFFAAAVLMAFAVFSQTRQSLLFTIAPVIIFAAFRLRLFAAMLIVAAVSAVAVFQTLAGNGVIAAANPNLTERMYVLQLFMAANLFTVLPLRALIGERDRLGMAFAQSDRLFRRIAEASPAGIIHFDTMARPTFVNGRWTDLTGQGFDTLAGDGWLDAIDDRFRSAARSLWARARATDQPMSAEYPFLLAGRPAGWAELNIYPELDDTRLLGFVARLTDVSARRSAEAALKDREALYRLVTENAHDVIFRLALDGRILYASSASSRVLGRDDLVGQDFRDRIHPDDAAAFATIVDCQADLKADPVVRFRFDCGDHRYLWVEASHRLVLNPVDGEPQEVVVSLRDVERRRRSEIVATRRASKLRESNRLMSMAEELAQVGHWRFDFARGELDCSRNLAVACGLDAGARPTPAEIIALVHPQDRARVLRLIAGARGSLKPTDAAIRLALPDGSERHLRVGAQADFDGDRHLTGLFGVVRDKTEYIVVQEQLIEARDEAEAAALAKSHFLATMSHEIRTPMTGVLGMIDLLRAEPDAVERDRYFDTLKQSADLLMAVLDDVLDFSRIDSDAVKLACTDFDLEALVNSTIDLFGNAASRKGLLLSLDARIANGAMVKGDPVRIQQVVSNLLANAIKFTARGRITVTLGARPAAAGCRSWTIEVRDTGVGIDQADIGKLFEPFVQAGSGAAHHLGGTGLGLAISRRLVEAMGGEVGVTSRVGRGSTFWLKVPLANSDRQAASSNDLPARDIVKAGGSLDLLVAEDNPVNQMLIGAILRRLDHRVTCVDNGRLAVDAARERRFDCILMDMQMPEMDGLAATRAIRASGGPSADVTIIALTADASPERRRFYEGAGLSGFMTKPIDRALLVEHLGAVAEGKRRATQTATPADAATIDGALFDHVLLGELRAAIGADRVDQLLALLDRECDERMVQIRRHDSSGDLALVRREAHSLKGAASAVGATALTAIAERMEAAPTAAAAARLVAPLAVQAERTRVAIAVLTGAPDDQQRAS